MPFRYKQQVLGDVMKLPQIILRQVRHDICVGRFQDGFINGVLAAKGTAFDTLPFPVFFDGFTIVVHMIFTFTKYYEE